MKLNKETPTMLYSILQIMGGWAQKIDFPERFTDDQCSLS